ncbi:unnamed protein product, partial [Ascophyllum nodosum]
RILLQQGAREAVKVLFAMPKMIVKGSVMSFLAFKGKDWSCIMETFFNNISILLGILSVLFNMTHFGVPINAINEVVYQRIVPGMGITLFLGNTYYTYLSMRRSRQGRDFTPQFYGINTPGAFAFAFNIIYPVYFAGTGDSTENFLKAYKVALAGNLLSGVISVILGVLGPQMLTIIPPAALLVPLAGVGFAFLGLEQAVASFSTPMVGFM